MLLQDISVYRLTHIDNIPHILRHGITHRKLPLHNPEYISIGDSSLISARSNRLTEITNGQHVIETISLGEYIPFYFGVRMPMLYVVQMGGNFVPKAVTPENIVYLACSIAKIDNLGLTFYFSDGHATDNLSTFYNKELIYELPNIIDWAAVKAKSWSGNENLLLKRKKQAEFLIKEDVPVACITGFVCYNENARNKLRGWGIDKQILKVFPSAYF
jgi:hypothetical protein